jgi:predicted nucleic acid-binding protein
LILADTGPLVALFDPRDELHTESVETLRTIREPLLTTVPVLTEAFHMLSPGSHGAGQLRAFVAGHGLSVWFLTAPALARAFELMERYTDHPMDLADASLVATAEATQTRRIFTLDRDDFETYRIRRGHRYLTFQIV